jgi:xanthosine utilization system XapX-like protein
VSKISRSWDLISQSFAVLLSDRALIFLPVVSGLFNLSISAVILSGGALLFHPELQYIFASHSQRPMLTPGMWAWLFVFYVVNYSIVVFFNVALVSIASSRLAGGHATLNDGLQAAWERKFQIIEGAFLAATVGIVLRSVEDRMGWLGRLIIRFIGVAWSLATYLAVPVLAAERVGPVEALQRSAALFTKTWGEELVGGFSFGLIFTLLAMPSIALPMIGAKAGPTGIMIGAVFMLAYWLMLGVISSAVEGIFMAALYRYATTKEIPSGYRRDDFLGAWQPKK